MSMIAQSISLVDGAVVMIVSDEESPPSTDVSICRNLPEKRLQEVSL